MNKKKLAIIAFIFCLMLTGVRAGLIDTILNFFGLGSNDQEISTSEVSINPKPEFYDQRIFKKPNIPVCLKGKCTISLIAQDECIVTRSTKDDPDVDCLFWNDSYIRFEVKDKINSYSIKIVNSSTDNVLISDPAKSRDIVTIQYKKGLDVHIGNESTTVSIQTANNQIWDDTYIKELDPYKEFGASAIVGIGDQSITGAYDIYLKYYIFSLPYMNIDDASLDLHIVTNELDGSEWMDLTPYQIYSNYSIYKGRWEEGNSINGENATGAEISWNKKPLSNTTGITGETVRVSNGDSGWKTFNITNIIESFSDLDKENFTLTLNVSAKSGSLSFPDHVTFSSKEDITLSNRPMLNITYSGVNITHFETNTYESWNVWNNTEWADCSNINITMYQYDIWDTSTDNVFGDYSADNIIRPNCTGRYCFVNWHNKGSKEKCNSVLTLNATLTLTETSDVTIRGIIITGTGTVSTMRAYIKNLTNGYPILLLDAFNNWTYKRNTFVTYSDLAAGNYDIAFLFNWNNTINQYVSGIGAIDDITIIVASSGAPAPPSITISTVTNSTTNESIYVNYSYSGDYNYSEFFNGTTLAYNGSNTYYNFTGLDADTQYNMTIYARYNESVFDVWSNFINTSANTAGDTCSCPGLNQNWENDLSDYCILNSNCDLGTGSLTFINDGNFTCNSTLSTSDLGDVNATGGCNTGGQCTLWINSNCYINMT